MKPWLFVEVEHPDLTLTPLASLQRSSCMGAGSRGTAHDQHVAKDKAGYEHLKEVLACWLRAGDHILLLGRYFSLLHVLHCRNRSV